MNPASNVPLRGNADTTNHVSAPPANNPTTFTDPLGLKTRHTCGRNGLTVPEGENPLSYCKTHMGFYGGNSQLAFFSNNTDEFDLLGPTYVDDGEGGLTPALITNGGEVANALSNGGGNAFFGGGVESVTTGARNALDKLFGPSLRQTGESVRACVQRVGNAVFGKTLNNAMVLTSITGLLTLPTFGAEIYPTQIVPGVVYKGSLLETAALEGTGSGLRAAQVSTATISKVAGPLSAVSTGVELALAVDCR